ncbi:phage baseplate assembly protein V [Pedobacter sp. PF22-3]|uniref:type VI secretion system Vgr family protein n=1 Tax=Pedobacter sp. PF22-3 TaxID=2994467 RepID=UPI0022474DA9|nr:phage baseplate assembly protein V [Pedobacter sp. PF22-3]MCX2495266.1 phage baseplate assembly protein V [Pedobacter sp. PF22-3]
MEHGLIAEINIEGKSITHFDSFDLKQQFNNHHYFELRFKHDQLALPGLIRLDDSRNFVGKTLTASFGHQADRMQEFAGLVTKVELAQEHGYHGVIVVSGYSPTILIDRGPDLGSYLAKDLNEIVKLATKDTPANDLKIVSNASRKEPIDYLIQYKESDFEFLNRLSGEYHEWFYYDGTQLNFGKPDKQKDVALFYGRDVQSLEYSIGVAPIKHKRFAYNPKQDEMLENESSGATSGSPDLAHAIQASNSMYSKTFNQPSMIRVDNSNDIKSHVENEEKANISELLKISAKGDNAELALGSIAEITMSVRQEIAFMTESLGKFLITGINHHIDVAGKYTNTFEGLEATTERILVKNYKKPQPDMQLADVIDNDDPQGQGRIKVKFKWECLTNDLTEWLRVVSPNAGSGDTGKNRGFHVIPEKGDQVVIAFEEGNVARPVVMGSVYHGKSGDSSGFKNSNTKGLTSRKGSALTFDDLNHALNMGTNAANFINIKNGQALLTAQAGSKIVIHTGLSTITMDKDGHVSITGKSLSVDFSESIDIQSPKITMGNLAPAGGATPEQAAAATKTIDIKGETITIEAKDLIDAEAKAMNLAASENDFTIDGQKNLTIGAAATASLNGGKVEINKS